MSWVNKNVNPNSLLKVNEEVEVVILEIDNSKRRISLGLKQCTENPWKKFADKNKKGDLLEGKIKNITDFGLFVELSDNLDGLIHLSDISWDDSGENVIKKYKLNDLVKFKILEIDLDKERVSLGIKQLTKDSSKTDKLVGSVMTGIIEEIEKDKIHVSFDENKKGFIKKINLAKLKSEQNTDRFAVKEKIDAKVIKKQNKEGFYELSLKILRLKRKKRRSKNTVLHHLELVLEILLVPH